MGSSGTQYMENLLWSSVFTFSILIHEYGHALMSLFFGAEPVILLQGFGGKTIFNESKVTDKQKFFIILAGPLFQGLWVLIAYLLSRYTIFSSYLLNYFLVLMTHINMRWLLLNLIPISPLDGGWLVRYVLEKKFGHKGYLASIIIGLVAASIAIPLFYWKGYHWFFITQLFICGWHYCKLWQKEKEKE